MTNIPSPSPQPAPDPRARAYEAGAKVARQRMAREAPLDAEALDQVRAADILVVAGTYDHVEMVLGGLQMPYTVLPAHALEQAPLRPEQLLVVNCPGQVPPAALDAVRAFVAGGGSLFTTDWALTHLVQPAFPGTIEYNRRPTGDDVVPIEILDETNPFLAGVMDGQDDPQWWLEGSSHPITVLDRDRVQVLIASRELGRRYGESPVAVLFPWEAGEVFHMISHYYLQRTELRSERHRAAATGYFSEKGLNLTNADRLALEGMAIGDVESAAVSSRLMANVIARKKRGVMKEGDPR